MSSIYKSIENFINDPANHDGLAIVKGARNGFIYGFQVRLAHSVVMAAMFRKGSFKERLWGVYEATKAHSSGLAKFVIIYKTVLFLLKQGEKDKTKKEHHAFVAGLIAGYFVYGRGNQSTIHQQIVLYIFSRAFLGFFKHAVREKSIPTFNGKIGTFTYPLFASLSWGVCMYLFNKDSDSLQDSLRRSMDYIYNDSDSWSGLNTFFWKNK